MRKTGYSGKPLYQKLGFKPGFRVGLINAPARYPALLADAADVEFVQSGTGLDAVHVFLSEPEGIAPSAKASIPRLKSGGMLWLSWAKKASKLHAGVSEDDLRRHLLPLGWVDVKVCALDGDYSGLKFLKRRE